MKALYLLTALAAVALALLPAAAVLSLPTWGMTP